MEDNRSLQVQDQEKRVNKKNPFRSLFLRGRWISVVLSIFLTIALFFRGFKRMKDSYDSSQQDAYSNFYQTAYDFAEKQNHVSNHALVSIDVAQEVSRLEVLSVSDSEFVIKEADKGDPTVFWLEVQGKGVFTVDLSACEFITDSERQYVLVKVPKPVLTEYSVSGTGKQFWKRNSIFNGSVADGVRLSQKQMSEGRVKLEDSMKQNRGFYEAAKNAAVDMIGSLVRKWNPNIPDLQVDVEFFENN